MANEKLPWGDLRKLIAQQANCSAEEVRIFMQAFSDVLIAGLQTDKQIKVKGLGTFALRTVAPRKSVNVNTGESIIIDGYNKVVFSAESAMKESVEKRIEPSSIALTVVQKEDTPIQKLSNQADEIVDLLGELGQEVKGERSLTPGPSPEGEGRKVKGEEAKGERLKESEQPEAKKIGEKHIGWWIAACAVILLGVAGYYYREPIGIGWQCFIDAIQTDKTVAEAPVVAPVETPIADTIAPVILPLSEQKRAYTEFIAQEKVPYGSRLAWLSYKYYGTKDLWVFIYEANRATIVHPNRLKHHQLVRIPKLEDPWTDISNPELKAYVDQLAQQYLHP